MSIPTEAATLPNRPAGADDAVGQAKLPPPRLSTFNGTLPNGVHRGVLVDLTTVTRPNKFKQGEMQTQLVWLFAIKGREADGNLAWYTSFSLHEKSKLPGTYEALKRSAPADGETVKRSTVLGAECDLIVKNKATQDGKSTFPKIETLVACA